jgi:small subunit ribosomal protein S2
LVSVTLKELLEAGAHFGHQTRRWNPKMKEYIFGARNGIYIIDLQKTVKLFRDALVFVEKLSAEGGNVLFVGPSARRRRRSPRGGRCGMSFVNQRWLGGTMTNFTTIKKSLARLKDLEEMAAGERDVRTTKKELAELQKERERLDKTLSGLKGMETLPQALFVVDPFNEKIAIAEAKKLGIPVIAVVDTNCDPSPVQFPIPGNDDAIRAIKLFAGRVADAITEGRGVWDAARREREAEAEKRGGAPQNIAERVRAREARRERLRAHATVKPPVRGRPAPRPARAGAEVAEVVTADEPAGD